MAAGHLAFNTDNEMKIITGNRRSMDYGCMLNGCEDDSVWKSLNEQQKDAVKCRARILFVNAGPGSGKTHLLTSKLIEYVRIARKPQKIVAISYTNSAADNIGERFAEKAKTTDLNCDYVVFNGTIHSYCFRMLKEYHSDRCKAFDHLIIDDDELNDLAEEISVQTGRKYSARQISPYLRSGRLPEDDRLADAVSSVREKYKVISIEGILTMFIRFLTEEDDFRQWMKSQVTVMAIDEAQDLSGYNYEILDGLISLIPDMKVFLVGDPRQNIFEFNGGSYRNLEEFLERNQPYAVKELSITYRCPEAVTDYVNSFSFMDCTNVKMRPQDGRPGVLSVIGSNDEKKEAESVAEWIEMYGSNKDCAVLCNNMKYMMNLMKELNSRRIHYKVLGGRRLLKPYVKIVNHVLRIMDSENEYSIRAVAEAARISLKDTSGMPQKEYFYTTRIGQLIASAKAEHIRNDEPFWMLMTRIMDTIMKLPGENKEMERDYQRMKELSMNYSTVQEYLMAFVMDKDSFAEFYEKDYIECDLPVEDDDFVTLSTIHSAKGLEWKNVFVMGLSESNFPNPYFCRKMNLEEQRKYYSDELKKMYVAATRARESLVLTYSRSITRKGYTFRTKPSRFLPKAAESQTIK